MAQPVFFVYLLWFMNQKYVPNITYTLYINKVNLSLDLFLMFFRIVILVLFTREHKFTQVLKDCLSSLTCHVTVLAHVSATNQNHPETLGTVQLAARIHRIRRRRVKVSSKTYFV